MIEKEQWELIKKELSGLYGAVEFKLDGKKITVAKTMISENKLALLVYIDEAINFSIDYELENKLLIQKVWHKNTKAFYTAKDKAEINKLWGKREAKKEFDLDKKMTIYSPYFNTYNVLERQYKKLKDLVLVEKVDEIKNQNRSLE